MNQTPPTPAQRLAHKIRARTNDTRDILDLLHDIAQGEHDATEHDRLTATGILFDRGYGKTPKLPPAPNPNPDPAPSTEPVLSPVEGSDPDPESAESDNHANHSSDTPQTAIPHKEPESPRLVTQLDDSLHQSIGPAPSASSWGCGRGACPELVEGSFPRKREPRVL